MAMRMSEVDVTTRALDLGLPAATEILPHEWPADNIVRQLLPGDLSQFAANRGPRKTELAEFHPFRFDSKINAGGGLIYFDEYARSDDLKASLHIMGVYLQMRDYAVFAAKSAEPARDDFLDQLRFVSHHALECGYLIRKRLYEQPHSLWEVIEAFLDGQRRKWGPSALSGTRGGDGDGAGGAWIWLHGGRYRMAYLSHLEPLLAHPEMNRLGQRRDP